MKGKRLTQLIWKPTPMTQLVSCMLYVYNDGKYQDARLFYIAAINSMTCLPD